MDAGRRRGIGTAVAVGVIVLAGGAAVVGSCNPWHLVVVDRWLNHPWIAGLVVILATGLLWHLCARSQLLKVTGLLGVTGLLVVWLLGGWASLVLNDPFELTMGPVANRHNDVEVSAVSNYDVWEVSLRADRGFWSRENHLVTIGYGDSGPPSVDLRFDGPDELVVTTDGKLVARIRFDPHDLGTKDIECRTVRPRFGGKVGCL